MPIRVCANSASIAASMRSVFSRYPSALAKSRAAAVDHGHLVIRRPAGHTPEHVRNRPWPPSQSSSPRSPSRAKQELIPLRVIGELTQLAADTQRHVEGLLATSTPLESAAACSSSPSCNAILLEQLFGSRKNGHGRAPIAFDGFNPRGVSGCAPAPNDQRYGLFTSCQQASPKYKRKPGVSSGTSFPASPPDRARASRRLVDAQVGPVVFLFCRDVCRPWP